MVLQISSKVDGGRLRPLRNSDAPPFQIIKLAAKGDRKSQLLLRVVLPLNRDERTFSACVVKQADDLKVFHVMHSLVAEA